MKRDNYEIPEGLKEKYRKVKNDMEHDVIMGEGMGYAIEILLITVLELEERVKKLEVEKLQE